MLDIIKLLNRSINATKVCNLVIQAHGSGVIALYKHSYMKVLAVKAIDVISQNLEYLFYNPKFVLQVISQTTLFHDWNALLASQTGPEPKTDDASVSKIGKCLLHLATDPECQLAIIHFFVQKFLDMILQAHDFHLQREVDHALGSCQ